MNGAEVESALGVMEKGDEGQGIDEALFDAWEI